MEMKILFKLDANAARAQADRERERQRDRGAKRQSVRECI